jgi:hypothetical protein
MLHAKFNMEQDIFDAEWLCQKIRTDTDYAQEFYAALCNNIFHKRNEDPDALFSFSWRHAGAVVADVRRQGDYLDWYCSGIVATNVREGSVTETVRDDLKKINWDVWTDIVRDHIDRREADEAESG